MTTSVRRWASWGQGLLGLGRRSREVLLLSAVTGAVVGLGVAGFEWVTAQRLLEWLFDLPLVWQAVVPGIGLALCALALRFLGRGASPATSDEYIRNFHQPDRALDVAKLPARMVASIATLGLGGAMGLEGPSMYLGAAAGTAIQRRFRRLFSPGAGKVLMVAGSAAGVAAIFKAPATGTVFALEVPYQDDTARRMLLPALTASASSYLVYVAINGTDPLFPTAGSPPFGFRELGGALLLGLLCGGGARVFALMTRTAKALQARLRPVTAVVAATAVTIGLFVTGRIAAGETLTIGPGYHVIDWLRSTPSLWLVALVLGLRAVATATTIAGGGAGGLFIPLVLLGALAGQLVGGALGEQTVSLFPVVGVAAFLGAGYRTPLAAVMFVAESTGRPGFIVPGLLAAAVSQLVMGRASVSGYQETGRLGHLEARFRLPVTSAIHRGSVTVAPDTSLDELVWRHLIPSRQTTACVVDGTTYLGMVRLDDLDGIPRDRWAFTPVAYVANRDVPVASPDWRIEDAVDAIEAHDTDRLPVTDGDAFVGIVTLTDIIRLDQILRHSGGLRQGG